MIEKLSDEKIDGCIDAVESKIRNLHGSQTNIKKALKVGMQQARDYYDAQIDKQTKTMEELWDMFNLPVPLEARKKINKWNGRHTKDTLLFGYAVGFFLAAGGTIKDGD